MLKKTLVVLFLLVIIGFIFFKIIDEPLPEGEEGPRAEWLTDQVFQKLNKAAWDSLSVISWSFPGDHHYVWSKQLNEVEVRWGEYKAMVNTAERTGEVWKNDVKIEKDAQKYVDEALGYFFNDSFWLIAPFKLRDPGTIRKVVDYEGKEALLVQYTSGGVTPGDSYLWIFDEEYRPVAWKFWVNILPIGGLEFSWEEWSNMEGAEISTFHDGILDIKINNLKVQ